MNKRTRKSARKNWTENSKLKLADKSNDDEIDKANIKVAGKSVQQNVPNAEISDLSESIINKSDITEVWSEKPRQGYFNGRAGPGRPKQTQATEGSDDNQKDVSLADLKQELRKLVLRLAKKAKPESFSAASQLLSQIEKLMVSENQNDADDKIINVFSQIPRSDGGTGYEQVGPDSLPEPAIQPVVGEQAADTEPPSEPERPHTGPIQSNQGNVGQPITCKCGFEVPGNLNSCPQCQLNLIDAGIRILPPIHRNPNPLLSGDDTIRNYNPNRRRRQHRRF